MFDWLLGVSGMVMLWVGYWVWWVDNVVGFGNIVRLFVGRGLVVRRMMTKLVGVGRSNISGQTQIVSL